jgi:hypothetical protein
VVGDGPEAEPPPSSAPAGERSRRQLLSAGGGGLLGAAVLLAGCTSKVAAPSNVHIDKNAVGSPLDVTLLNELLGLEYRSIAAYTAAIPLLPQPKPVTKKAPPSSLFAPPPAVKKHAPAPPLTLLVPLSYAAAQQFLTQELAHVTELKGFIKQAGGRPAKPAPSYPMGHPKSKQEVLDLLHHTEELLLASYHHAIPLLTPSSLRGAAAAIFGNHAQHTSVLRLDLGLHPIPSAFVTGPE